MISATSVTQTAPKPAPPAPPAPKKAPAAAAATNPGLDPDVIAERSRQARIAEFTADTLPPGVIEAGPPAYFRTYDQLKDAMYGLQKQYPDLVQVTDIGDGYEKTQGRADRDILALTLTNKKDSRTKPVALSVGGVHAREIANPELLMTFADQLLKGYGTDPEATALLDSREIDLIPMVNPDGHAYIERAYEHKPNGNMMKRKNASGAGGEGTDINRNFDFHWGGPGASSNPRSETYRGAGAASEPETQAVQDWVGKRKPNMFIDWHSYSKLNMYPWGDTKDKAPDYEGYKAIAEKFTSFNHYSPMQSVNLYPTTGTTDDYSYGAHNVPAFAIETGSNFHQNDKEFAQTLAENLPVLWYSSKIANDPFHSVNGPDALDVNVTTNAAPGVDPGAAQITASISDATSGAQVPKRAEWVADPNARPGTGTPLTAADGAFDSPNEQVTGTVSTDKVTPGSLVCVRAQDADGNWGPTTPQWVR